MLMYMKGLDKKIILQLIEDADRPAVKIADEVGATRQTVSKKIKQFKKSGLIKSVVARLDPEKFGLGIKAYVFLREDPSDELRGENEEVISKYREIYGIHRIFGRYSAVLEVLAENRDALTSLVKRIHGLEGVLETETFIVHSTVKNEPEAPFVGVLRSE